LIGKFHILINIKNKMRTFTELKEINEMKYGQPLYSAKDQMKNALIAASGNDQRVLNDIVDCLSDQQMKSCFDRLSKVYGYTGDVGQIEQADI
jgi:hypothetical protein